MKVRVDEAGHDPAAGRIEHLLGDVVTDAGDVAVTDRHVTFEPFAREHREHAPAADDRVGGLVSRATASRRARSVTVRKLLRSFAWTF